jgi:ABC-type molybdate transport system ATPase subunit
MNKYNTTLEIESKAGETLIIPLNNKVTILTGDSATGKTKLIRFIKLLLNDKAEIKDTSIKDIYNKIIICESKKEMLDVIKREIADKIIIVDKFDTMSDDSEIIKFIRESSNLFIVAAHKEK